METKYYIVKTLDDKIILLSTYPTSNFSGYFCNYHQSELHITLESYELRERSSRDGMIKENPNLEFKPIGESIFAFVKQYYKHIVDVYLGFHTLMSTEEYDNSRCYCGDKTQNYGFYKVDYRNRIGSWHLKTANKLYYDHPDLEFSDLDWISGEHFKSISIEFFDMVDDVLKNSLSTLYKFLRNYYNDIDKEPPCGDS